MKPNNMNHKIIQSIVLLHLFHYPQKNTLIPLTLTEYHHTFLRLVDNIFKPYKNRQITNYETETIMQSWGKFEGCEHAVNHQASNQPHGLETFPLNFVYVLLWHLPCWMCSSKAEETKCSRNGKRNIACSLLGPTACMFTFLGHASAGTVLLLNMENGVATSVI